LYLARTPPSRARGSCRERASLEGQFHFLGAPRGVRESRADIVSLQVGVRLQDLLVRTAGSEETQDGPYGHPHTPDAGAPAHDGGIAGDALEEIHGRSIPKRRFRHGSDPVASGPTASMPT